MSDKAQTQTYKASCHCGAFAYTVKTASLSHPSTKITRCNCSICARNGLLLIYAPDNDVEFTSGRVEELKSYTFASHSVAHLSCPTCACSLLARSIRPGFFDGTSIVNVRMFEDVELEKCEFTEADGRSYTAETGGEGDGGAGAEVEVEAQT